MICIIDYGLGNIGSILNMLKYMGINAVSSSDPEIIHTATHLILPGVGSFDSGINKLKEKGLAEVLNREVLDVKKPVLGICLGAQLMLDSSTEGSQPGLGWIKGNCLKFDTALGIKIPHMGWNTLDRIYDNCLFTGLPGYPPRFYFVHSYYFNLADKKDCTATSLYGREFASSFRKGNIYGVQFHPEKSHKFGMQVLLNFAKVS